MEERLVPALVPFSLVVLSDHMEPDRGIPKLTAAFPMIAGVGKLMQ